MRLGLISDTHGLLRPEVIEAFDGVQQILHAGDVGDPDILTELEAIAPVTAVWGNTDGWNLRSQLPETADLELGGVRVRVLHGHGFGRPVADAVAEANRDVGMVVFGHSHRPEVERVGAVLAVNPGSAGPVRFSLPVTVAIAEIGAGASVTARLVKLVRREG
ncbi:MAG: YfcE family phosphodiesterase [Gemmatimonas sp.]|nr:YfcE family phosphodiesterase [Gemmatimonas sp.]